MTSVLGMPLDAALKKLAESGITDAAVKRCDAPRARASRGTLRIVAEKDGGRALTVCLFPDDVTINNTNETEA